MLGARTLLGAPGRTIRNKKLYWLKTSCSQRFFQTFCVRRPGTEEDLLSGQAFFVQATLAEYNGNSHGPETLACQVRPQEPHRYSCLRVAEPKKASEGPLPSASSGGQDQQMQMQGMHHGTAGSGHEHPMHQGEHMQGMHGKLVPVSY